MGPWGPLGPCCPGGPCEEKWNVFIRITVQTIMKHSINKSQKNKLSMNWGFAGASYIKWKLESAHAGWLMQWPEYLWSLSQWHDEDTQTGHYPQYDRGSDSFSPPPRPHHTYSLLLIRNLWPVMCENMFSQPQWRHVIWLFCAAQKSTKQLILAVLDLSFSWEDVELCSESLKS